VLWVVVKKGRKKVVEVDFIDDLQGAIRLYTKAKAAGKPFATMRCTNSGFPPPDKYRPYYVIKKKPTGKTKVVVKNGKRKKVKVVKREEVYREPMAAVNLKGIWWCPYCMEMRRFMKQDGFQIEGVHVKEVGYHCPICGISHRDHHVRKWNPQAQRIQYKLDAPRARRSSATKRRRSRRG
jgi:hypothetical protein